MSNSEGKLTIPVWRKAALTAEEAAAYSNIGINRLREILYAPDCTFALRVGETRALVKRKKFEEFIDSQMQI